MTATPRPRPFDRELALKLFNVQVPKDVQFSPDGKHVVYTTALHGHTHRVGKYHLSTLWLASTTEPKSAKQLTSGEFDDVNPVWHPNGKDIAFLSDRGAQGKPKAIWTLSIDNPEKPVQLSNTSCTAGISMARYSPDGKSIAYLSMDEKSQDYKDKQERGEPDPIVWNGTEDSLRLRLMDLETKEVRVLSDIGKHQHVLLYAWGTDGKKILIATNEKPEWEEMFHSGTTVSLVDLETGDIEDLHTTFRYVEDIALGGDGVAYLLQTSTDCYWSSGAVFVLDPKLEPRPLSAVPVSDRTGRDDTAEVFRVRNGVVTLLHMTSDGVSIRTLDEKELFRRPYNAHFWDIHHDAQTGEWTLAVSDSTINTPPELTIARQGQDDQILTECGKAFEGQTFGKFHTLKCQSADGKMELDGHFIAPASSLDSNGVLKHHVPTVVMPHGGPSNRDAENFCANFYWPVYLLAQGYGVLFPQFRGGYGRGTEFAVVSGTGAGKESYDDVITITDNAIKKGFSDPERLVIAGWSNGGLQTFLCSVRNGRHGLGWRFKAAIAGAGMSDLESLCFSSDIGSTAFAELNNGIKPWTSSPDEAGGRSASGVWQVASAAEEAKRTGQMVIPPMLILHGQSDVRVPFDQSVGFWRALREHKLPCEFVAYPGQGHSMTQQVYWVDLLERVSRWCDVYTGAK
ncbi:hypothetical protein VHEMI09290 [[Torrubiella] hemipterigena]|uniref:Dipeptidyl-peptidase V n=1 Tax=[Torrubiella] hemipterigena TaxID=1531966 RepID=A0A0A1TG22_9HYPO|nr:hypothetical protein VHEMI09290 [[Torrubiella] hemipterigena]